MLPSYRNHGFYMRVKLAFNGLGSFMLLGYINLFNQIVDIEAYFNRPYIKVVKG